MALCLCFTLVFPATALGAKEFSDTKGHWAISYIQDLADQGYINGYPDGTFKPDRTMTKAEFTTALIGSLGITPSEPDFADRSPRPEPVLQESKRVPPDCGDCRTKALCF
jgi:hypothetical protein